MFYLAKAKANVTPWWLFCVLQWLKVSASSL